MLDNIENKNINDELKKIDTELNEEVKKTDENDNSKLNKILKKESKMEKKYNFDYILIEKKN